MARIQINDLVPMEDLTPEEMEEIVGAGRFSFQPTVESLENRELMDAGLGRSVLPRFAPPAAETAHVARMGQDFVPRTEVQMDRMYSALVGHMNRVQATPESTAPQQENGSNTALGRLGPGSRFSGVSEADGRQVFEEVKNRFNKDMINGQFNRWILWNVVDSGSKFEIKGSSIVVHLRVGYGVNPSEVHRAQVDFTYEFADHGNDGGASVYKLVNASNKGYEGLFKPALDQLSRDAMAGPFRGVPQGEFTVFNPVHPQAPTPEKAGQALFADAQHLLNGHGFKNLSLKAAEEIEGGVRLKISADRDQGQGVTFSVDVKYIGSHGFRADRANVDFREHVAVSAAEAEALVRMIRHLNGRWRS